MSTDSLPGPPGYSAFADQSIHNVVDDPIDQKSNRSSSFSFLVVQTPVKELAFTNFVYVSRHDVDLIPSPYVSINSQFVYKVAEHYSVLPGTVAMNKIQRQSLNLSTGSTVSMQPWFQFDQDTDKDKESESIDLVSLELQLSFPNDMNEKAAQRSKMTESHLLWFLNCLYRDHVFGPNQSWLMELPNTIVCLTVIKLQTKSNNHTRGKLVPTTQVQIVPPTNLQWKTERVLHATTRQ